MATVNETISLQNSFCGLPAWHDAGVTGKGVHIWNCEGLSSHGRTSTRRIHDAAPGAVVHNGSISVKRSRDEIDYFYVEDEDGKQWDPEEFISAHNIKILSRSMGGDFAGANDGIWRTLWENLQKKYGLIVFEAADNDARDEKNRPDGHDLAILVGAVNLIKGKVSPASYTSVTDDVDFATFTGVWSGTSFSCPYLAGTAALIIERFGSMSQTEMHKLLMMLARDVHEEGRDNRTGWGVPVLPDLAKKYITMTTLSPKYYINGEKHTMDTRPVNLQGRVFVPLRVIAEALGAAVDWQRNPDETIKVLIDKDGTHIELNTQSLVAYIDGRKVYLDFAPFITSRGRTLVPIRFIAEAFGCKVDWVQREAKVMILEAEG